MSESICIHVNVLPSPYEVVVQPGLLRRLGAAISFPGKPRKLCVVSDTNVAPLHLRTLTDSLKDQFEIVTCVLPAGENHKTLESIARIYDTFLPAAIDRKTPLLALGGGVVGDMTGFAAATILRGVPFIQAPTTLLAMVDASVGGKTGVDHPCGKNLIGAFHQPSGVYIDPEVLLTLPRREFVGGLAECIKHDIIRDVAHFASLPQIIEKALQLDVPTLAQLVAHNVQIKARVVEADPFEKGERAHLNFGHTFAHAIEKVSKFDYSHGEAVALGMVAASRLAQQLGMLDAGSVDAIVGIIAGAGLPTAQFKLDIAECVAAMAYDKKVAGNKIRFVLPDRIGHAVIRDDIPPALVHQVFASMKG